MPRSLNSSLMKPLVVLAFPGMYLVYKISEFKRQQQEQNRRKVTERELAHLNHKIDKLLTKLDEHEPELANTQDEECVICISAKATMQTFPCGHRVVCRKCFVKTIQMAVSQRMLPLRCVICRTKIIRLKQSSHGRATPVGTHLATARAALLSPCETLAGTPRPPFLTPKDFETDATALPDNHYRNSATACQFHRHCRRRSSSSMMMTTPTPAPSPVHVSAGEEKVDPESPRLKPHLEPALFHPLMESDDNEEDEEDVSQKSAPRTPPRPALQRLDPSQVQVRTGPTELLTTALIHPPPRVPRRSHRGTPLPSPTTPTTPDHPQDALRAPTSPTTSFPRSPSTSSEDACKAPSPPPSKLPSPLSSPTIQNPPPLPKPPKPQTRCHNSSKEALASQGPEPPTAKPTFVGQPAIVLPPPPTSTEVRKRHHRVSPTGSTRVPSRFERFRDMHVRRPMPLFPIPEKEEGDLLEGAFCRVPPGASDYLIRTSSPKISVVQDRVPLLHADSDQHSPSFRSQLKTKMAGFPSFLGSHSPLRVFRGAGKHKKVADVK